MIGQLLSFALGVWLMAAPTVFHEPEAALINDRTVGPIVVLIGVTAAHEIARSLRWLNVLLGIWMMIAPWVLGYPLAGMVNAMAVGILLAVLGQFHGSVQNEQGGGWTALRMGERRSVSSPVQGE